MFAVIKTGGKQYKVQEGDVLQIEKLNLKEAQKFTFDQVLLIEDGKDTLIGMPYIEKAIVKAVVLENFKDKKVIVFKKKRRKQYKKKAGHRQELTRVRIEEIVSDVKVKAKEKPEKPVKKVDKKAVPQEQKPKVVKTKEAEKKEPKKKIAEKSVKKAAAPKVEVEKAKAKPPVKKQTGEKKTVRTKKMTSKKE